MSATVALYGCTRGPAPMPDDSGRVPPTHAPGAAVAREEPPFRLLDVAADRGVHFRHTYGSRSPITIVDTMGSGCAFFDYDGDGLQDILLVNAGQDFQTPRQEPASRLFRNVGGGRFVDVTAQCGIIIDGYATGCCVGDYDNDGHEDVFVTGYKRSWLFHNRGNGTFQDVTQQAGILHRPNAWGMSCAFVDVDRDGWLDLYVADYVRYDSKIPYCTTANVQHGCTPNQYSTQSKELYINQRNGTFVEKAAALGADDPSGASLGLVVCDFDNDGWPDIFIANDGTPNALLHNERGHFRDVAQSAGIAYSDDGTMRAGMGTDAGDIDGDGRMDLVVTNFQNEPTSVFRNLSRMSFREVSYPSGVGTPSMNHLKFGVAFLDLDGDGKLDIYEGNGHVFDNVEKFNDLDTFEQVDQVFLNIGGGRFKEIHPDSGAFPGTRSVTRSVATGDFNNDGARGILINSLGRPARLLENHRSKQAHWIGLKLVGTRSNRSAIGARVDLRGASGHQVGEVRSGSSYLSQSDPRVLFNLGGCGDPRQITIDIRWPSGTTQVLKPSSLDRYVTVRESQ